MKARTYGSLRLDRQRRLWVATGVEPHVVIRMKKIFPKIPLHQSDDFTFPHNPFNCTELLWLTDRYPLALNASDATALRLGRKAYEGGQAELERIMTPGWSPPAYAGLREGCAVRPYQAQAVEVTRRGRRLLLGDDVGLGKTYTAIALLLDPGTLPAAVVVEPHLAIQWKEKVEAFSTLRVHIVEKRQPYTLPKADVYVFKYSNVLGWGTIFRTGFFKAVVYDEVQNLRGGSGTGRGAACTILSRHAAYVLAMSATPIFNMGAEIWQILHFLNPDDHPLGSHGDFAREWCIDEKRVGDPKALGSHLRERHIMIRRTKGDVGQQMDRVNTVPEEIPYDTDREREVEDLAKALAIKTLSAQAFVERGRAARDLDMLMRHTTGVAKAKDVAAYVRMLLEAGRPVLLCGWHRDVYEIWNRELKDFRPVMYTGSESPAQKNRARLAFQNGETDLMIMSLRSGSGLDGIQARCSTIVFGELDWSPLVHRQCTGRLDREGQPESTVDAIFLHAAGGSDPAIIELLGVKSSQSHGIMDPELGVTVARSEANRIQELARRFLKRRGIRFDDRATGEEEVPPDPDAPPFEEEGEAAAQPPRASPEPAPTQPVTSSKERTQPDLFAV